MFIRLKDSFLLRGWQGMTCAVVQKPDLRTRPLEQHVFQLLLLCDGVTDFDDLELTEQEKKILSYLLQKEYVEERETPEPLQEEQNYIFYDNRYVRTVFWSMTGRCNYKCRHCFMDAPEAKLGELSTDEALSLIDQVAECGVMHMDLTGGEPFVRKDFFQLLDRILSHGIQIGTVYTNGWLVNRDLLAQFEQRGIHPDFSISLDGLGWHDWMRRVSGAEKAAMNALELCSSHGFGVSVEMCVHRGNRDTLRSTVNRVAEFGAPVKTSNVMETDLWLHNSEGNALNNAEYVDAMLDYIPYFYEDGMPTDVMLSGVAGLQKHSTKYHIVAERYDGTEKCLNEPLCGAIRYASYITPEGRLLPCMPMTSCNEQELFPKVQEIGLKKGLSDSYYMQFANSRVGQLLKENQKCAVCEYRHRCGGGCRASALCSTGKLMGCDPIYCELWENGWVRKIRNVIDGAIAQYCPEKLQN